MIELTPFSLAVAAAVALVMAIVFNFAIKREIR